MLHYRHSASEVLSRLRHICNAYRILRVNQCGVFVQKRFDLGRRLSPAQRAVKLLNRFFRGHNCLFGDWVLLLLQISNLNSGGEKNCSLQAELMAFSKVVKICAGETNKQILNAYVVLRLTGV